MKCILRGVSRASNSLKYRYFHKFIHTDQYRRIAYCSSYILPALNYRRPHNRSYSTARPFFSNLPRTPTTSGNTTVNSAPNASSSPPPMAHLLLPPVNREMRVLDRDFFKKKFEVAALVVNDVRDLQKVKKGCKESLLGLSRKDPMLMEEWMEGTEGEEGRWRVLKDGEVPVAGREPVNGQEAEEATPVADGEKVRTRKLIPLHPSIKGDDPSTIPSTIKALIEQGLVELLPSYMVELEYKDWNYDQLIRAILPEEFGNDLPHGFTLSGHIAHINLRAAFLPYKYVIAELILDKNPRCKTVVNKIEDVGVASEFRTFPMELLAGSPDTLTTVSESDCTFTFDFAKVYWNSRLSTEHKRICDLFRPGEAIADIMAGVGPFSIPAGKRRVFAWANDLNPDSYSSLVTNIAQNKVSSFVSAHNEDGRCFIKSSIKNIYKLSLNNEVNRVLVHPKVRFSRSKPVDPAKIHPPAVYNIPPTFSHFIMNLPASAIDFLDAFTGSYAGLEEIFTPYTTRQLPLIHVHCFQKPGKEAYDEICQRITESLGYMMKREDVQFTDVRLVAPRKMMYCATFRLPEDVGFAVLEPEKEKMSAGRKLMEERKIWARIKSWTGTED